MCSLLDGCLAAEVFVLLLFVWVGDCVVAFGLYFEVLLCLGRVPVFEVLSVDGCGFDRGDFLYLSLLFGLVQVGDVLFVL